jgi:catechol 2,3-dioxygenase-like lactoylglutathione lyase family enzyme
MSIHFNHTIVRCRDQARAAAFLSQVLGLGPPGQFGPFHTVELSNGVSLDFLNVSGEISREHYAFLVSEDEFDAIFRRIEERGIEYWADPVKSRPGTINHNDGGRGVYFEDPEGHLLEIITRPYGSG